MAEVITRFKLETTQYDSKLRDASKQLSDLTDKLMLAGKDFERFSQNSVESARALGNIESGASTVRDRLKDLVSAYNEVAKSYNVLTDQQKQTDYGKAMAESLTTLQGRITETKNELYNLGDNAKDTGGIMDSLASKFTINIDALKLFNMGLSAAKAALDVVKDAFFNNEQNLDEWGRTVAASESLYKGFLNALNTGDISGYLSNINTITQAARDAYDALDELATFNAFNKANIAGARADLSGAIADFREGTGSRDDVQKFSQNLIKELETKQELQADAYKKVITKVAAERGVSADALLQVMTGKWGTFKELKNLQYTGSRTVFQGGGMFGGGGVYQEAAPANDRERLAQAVKHLNDTEIDNFQSLAESAKMTEVEINNQRKMVARILNGRQGGGSGGGTGGRGGSTTTLKTEEQLNSEQIQKLTQEYIAATDERRNAIRGEIKVLQDRNAEIQKLRDEATGKIVKIQVDTVLPNQEQIGKLLSEQLINKITSPAFSTTLGIGNVNELKALQDNLARLTEAQKEFGGVSSEVWKAFQEQIDSVQGQIDSFKGGGQKGKKNTEEVKLNEVLGGLSGGMSQMISGMEQLGIEIPNELKAVVSGIQAVSSILTGISAILTVIEAVTSADALIPFGRGGIVKHAAGGWRVPGNNYADDVPALLTSGELVLNRAQQGNLASQLQGNMSNLNLTATISGEQIRLALNNASRRRGRGEYVTSKTIR